MEKIFLLIFSVVAFGFGSVCKAGNPLPIHADFTMGFGTPSHSVRPFDASIGLAYELNRVSIHAMYEADFFMPKDGLTKGYNAPNNLGGGVGYYFLPSKRFEARGLVTTTIGHGDYANTSYSLGVYWHCGEHNRLPTPIIGLGYNYRHFSTKPDYNGAFLSFGFRF